MISTLSCSNFSVNVSEYGEPKRICKLKSFLRWPYNKHLITKLSRSVWENLDLGQDSLARLIRAKYNILNNPSAI